MTALIPIGVVVFFLGILAISKNPKALARLEMIFGAHEESDPTDTGDQAEHISHTGELLDIKKPAAPQANTGRKPDATRPIRREPRPSRPPRNEVLEASGAEK